MKKKCYSLKTLTSISTVSEVKELFFLSTSSLAVNNGLPRDSASLRFILFSFVSVD